MPRVAPTASVPLPPLSPHRELRRINTAAIASMEIPAVDGSGTTFDAATDAALPNCCCQKTKSLPSVSPTVPACESSHGALGRTFAVVVPRKVVDDDEQPSRHRENGGNRQRKFPLPSIVSR